MKDNNTPSTSYLTVDTISFDSLFKCKLEWYKIDPCNALKKTKQVKLANVYLRYLNVLAKVIYILGFKI